MAGIPQTLPVPPLVNEMTMLNGIRLAAASGGGGGGGTAWGAITGTLSAQTDLQSALDGKQASSTLLSTLAAGFGGVFTSPGLVAWNGTDYQLFSGTIPAFVGGTGISNGPSATLTLPNAATTITTGGTLALGGFTLTVPATGTAALLGTANVFTTLQTVTVGAANTGVLASTGYSLTGSNATSMINLAGSINTSAAVSVFKLAVSITSPNANSNLFQVLGGASGTSNAFSINAALGNHYITVGTNTFIQGEGGTYFSIYGSSNDSRPCRFSQDTIEIGLRSILYSPAAAVFQLGLNAAGVTNQQLTAASRITSDGVGANLTISGGNGRGGAGGSLILSTYDTGAASTAGVLRSRLSIDTAGAVSFPVVTAVTTETVVSDTTWPVTINGVAYKICLKA